MRLLIVFCLGLLFGVGLLLSGMVDPAKVLGFLDVAGHWDPSLALVMGGAVLVSAPLFALARRRATAFLGTPLQIPTNRGIDRSLVLGSLLFGIGWGVAGICPGPGLVLASMLSVQGLIFVAAMLAGMALHDRIR